MNLIDRDKLIEVLKGETAKIPLVEENRDMFFHDSGYNCAIWSAILLAEKQPVMNQWIPCSERKPKEKGLYLVTLIDGTMETDRYFVRLDKWEHFTRGEVIAWQPLPKPYEEKENEKE